MEVAVTPYPLEILTNRRRKQRRSLCINRKNTMILATVSKIKSNWCVSVYLFLGRRVMLKCIERLAGCAELVLSLCVQLALPARTQVDINLNYCSPFYCSSHSSHPGKFGAPERVLPNAHAQCCLLHKVSCFKYNLRDRRESPKFETHTRKRTTNTALLFLRQDILNIVFVSKTNDAT